MRFAWNRGSNVVGGASRRLRAAIPLLAAVVAVGVAQLGGEAARAACTVCSPAAPVPPARHGTLVPTTILSDTTWFLHDRAPACGNTQYIPRYSDIDVEGGVIFGASGNHFEIFDARTAPGVPVKRGNICRPQLTGPGFEDIIFAQTDTDEYYNFLEAPDGDNTIVVIAGLSNMGAVIIKTNDLAAPQVIYQDDGYQGINVATALVGGVHHAFVVDGAGTGKIEVYDLARAKALGSPCRGTSCGVYKSFSGVNSSLGLVRGAANFLATFSQQAMSVWDVSSLSARRVGDIPGWAFGGDIWYQNGVLYAARGATAGGGKLEVYDFPCQSAGTCAPRLVRQYDAPGAISSSGSVVEASIDGNRAYVYVGKSSLPSGVQKEYLFDVTDADTAQELTPDHPDGYWGWYYRSELDRLP